MKIVTTRYNLVLAMFIPLFISGCVTKVDRLEYALEFAGENRRELEKVLEYYSDDSLKYRAAYFLIENMPRWYLEFVPENTLNGDVSLIVIL